MTTEDAYKCFIGSSLIDDMLTSVVEFGERTAILRYYCITILVYHQIIDTDVAVVRCQCVDRKRTVCRI